ncbi:MAG TPA: hypothetical protein PLF04_10235 [Candidatus Fermentibacter daniensis]|nr:hypothetical protein [Candidatus Fermentibacter daniensis]
MSGRFRLLSTILAAVAASGLVLPSSAFADNPGGGSSSSEDSASLSAYIAIGAGVVVAGLLLLDALSDSDAEPVPADGPSRAPDTAPGTSTGIDWSSVVPSGPARVNVIAVVPRDASLQDRAGRLIQELDRVSGFPVYDEPVILGGASGAEAYALARDFFDAGWMVALSSEADSVRIEIYGPGGLLDSRCIAPDEEAAAAGFVIDALTAAGY